jgi:DNA-directed RNA polymerase subunit K/omega
MTLKTEGGNDIDETSIKREDVLDRAKSAYEAVVAIAKEARRLNAVPGVYLKGGEKPIPRAVRNFMDGRVEYEVDESATDGRQPTRKGKKQG